jgi:hypothetical protein
MLFISCKEKIQHDESFVIYQVNPKKAEFKIILEKQ